MMVTSEKPVGKSILRNAISEKEIKMNSNDLATNTINNKISNIIQVSEETHGTKEDIGGQTKKKLIHQLDKGIDNGIRWDEINLEQTEKIKQDMWRDGMQRIVEPKTPFVGKAGSVVDDEGNFIIYQLDASKRRYQVDTHNS